MVLLYCRELVGLGAYAFRRPENVSGAGVLVILLGGMVLFVLLVSVRGLTCRELSWCDSDRVEWRSSLSRL
jgi:hypothetical protein